MFTGIIEEVAGVARLSGAGPERTLIVKNPFGNDIKRGDSIAVDGTCLTVTGLDAQTMSFFISAETVKKSIAAHYRAGTRVNLERALLLGGRLDGHLVTGHVDTVSQIASVKKVGAGIAVEIAIPAHFSPLMIERGSLAVNGISLTIAALHGDRALLSIIPETLKRTAFADEMKSGQAVNLEFDILGKYAARLLGPQLRDGKLRTLIEKL
jgi:riboflavin synthase